MSLILLKFIRALSIWVAAMAAADLLTGYWFLHPTVDLFLVIAGMSLSIATTVSLITREEEP